MKKNEQKPDKKENRLKASFRTLLGQGKREADRFLERRVDRIMKQDSALLEPLGEREENEARPTLMRGSVDGWFLLWTVLLLCFGAIMSYSASSVYAQAEFGDSMHFFKNYLFYVIGASLFTAIIVYFTTPQMWKAIGILIYGVAVIMLILVMLFGASEGEAQRWLDFGFFTVQPSEIAKTGVVLVLALYLSAHEKEITSATKWSGSFKHGVLIPGIIAGMILALVMLQSHISGVLIIGMLCVTVMFLGGMRVKWLGIAGGAIGAVGAVLVLFTDYAQNRVNSWLDLESDALGSGWQTLQGLYAIGSGGLFGVGLGSSRQKYGYVSEPQNDFVFTIICEELGFVGALLTILLFCCLVFRGFQIAAKAPNKFCALTVYGLTFKIALQAILNIAVVTNSIPNTGVSLPFFSSGGTALALQVFEIGIILSISRFSCQKKA